MRFVAWGRRGDFPATGHAHPPLEWCKPIDPILTTTTCAYPSSVRLFPPPVPRSSTRRQSPTQPVVTTQQLVPTGRHPGGYSPPPFPGRRCLGRNVVPPVVLGTNCALIVLLYEQRYSGIDRICFFERVHNWFPPITPFCPISLHSTPISIPLISPSFTSPNRPFYSIPPSHPFPSTRDATNGELAWGRLSPARGFI